MSGVEFTYRELSEIPYLEAVPLAHLSVQVGVVSADDLLTFDRFVEDLADRRFERVSRWLRAAGDQVRDRFGDRARLSTCLLVDDRAPEAAGPEPAQVMEVLTASAHRAGFDLDYLARITGCEIARDRPDAGPRESHPVADILAGSIVQEAAVGANGSRPPTEYTGWLANGQRSPGFRPAMDGTAAWEPPEAFGRDAHSVFVDIELWKGEAGPDSASGDGGDRSAEHDQNDQSNQSSPNGESNPNGESDQNSDDSDETDYGSPFPRRSEIARRDYSPALLTAVWHGLRLGLLRDAGAAVAVPYRFSAGEDVPRRWSALPAVTQLTADTAPFAAYQTLSILPCRLRAVEYAAGVILDHVQLDDRVLKQLTDRAAGEHPPFAVPLSPTGRISHLFLDDVHAALAD